MALLRSSLGEVQGPIVRAPGIFLRAAAMSDYGAWAELRAASREHLEPWEPQWSRDELTRHAFRRRVRHYQREAREDTGYAFLLFAEPTRIAALSMGAWAVRRGTPVLTGGATLSNVRRGVTQAATLGYWLGAPFTGCGLMSTAVTSVCNFAFDVLRLHRVEAAIMPSNQPSIRLAERVGFQREGLARSYLRINGRWEDHLLYALIADERRGVPAAEA
ncbi:MAG: GNAT family N-acetyltransferase [Hyphomicrobiaceae bacterium]